jgi:DnaK suppressor protein
MTTIDTTAIEADLREARARLVRQMEELGATDSGELRPDAGFEEGFADAAAATAERTEVLGVVESLKSQVDDIDAALIRIADGGYGVCVSCGKEIPAARLEARPESIYCVDCKSRR